MNKLLTIILSMLMVSSVTFAFSFNVDKPGINLVSRAGKTLDGYVEVVNSSKDPLHFTAYLNDWKIAASGAKQFFPAGTLDSSCSNWISISPKEFDLEPGKKLKVNYVMTVPATVVGGHYSVLFIETTAAGEKKANVLFSGRIGSVFYHQAMGTEIIDADLDALSVQADTSNIYIDYSFENKANIYLLVKPTLAVLDDQGKIVFRKKLEKFGTMAGQKMARSEAIQKVLMLKSYTAVITAEYGQDTFKVIEKEFTIGDKKIVIDRSGLAGESNVTKSLITPLYKQKDTIVATGSVVNNFEILKFNPVVNKKVVKVNLLISAVNKKVDVNIHITNLAKKTSSNLILVKNLSVNGSRLVAKPLPVKFAKGNYKIVVEVVAGDQKLADEKIVEIK